MTGHRYGDPGAFRKALDDRLKTTARPLGVPVNTVRRQFVLECYLARVFALPDCMWLLKGGTGLIVRIPGARHSRDLDLCRTARTRDLEESIHELVEAGRPSDRDPFVFEIVRRTQITGAEGHQLTVTARLAGTEYEKFPIDMTVRPDFVGRVEIVSKPLPLQIDDVRQPPPMRLYPMADQVADKVAAMYETHGGNASGRYRDLVDLVLITSQVELVPDDVIAARHLQEAVRNIVLPVRMTSPGPTWAANYPREARKSTLDAPHHSLDRALAQVSHQIDPALAGVAALRARP